MKRDRRPPKKWRRNMVAAAAFLAILDAVIVSATPNTTRIVLAVVVSLVVGYAIFSIWRNNSKLEKAPVDPDKGKSAKSKPPGNSLRV